MSLPGLQRITDSPTCILFETPSLVVINKHPLREPDICYKKIEDLMCRLRERGPCLAYGKEMYYKGKEGVRPLSSDQFYIVLGAQQIGEKNVVYFLPTLEELSSTAVKLFLSSTPEPFSELRTYYPSSSTDNKIFLVSHHLFSESVQIFHPPVPLNIPKSVKLLSLQEERLSEGYLKALLPRNLLSQRITEHNLKELTEIIFDFSALETKRSTILPTLQRLHTRVGAKAFGGISVQKTVNQLWEEGSRLPNRILVGDSVWWALPENEVST